MDINRYREFDKLDLEIIADSLLQRCGALEYKKKLLRHDIRTLNERIEELEICNSRLKSQLSDFRDDWLDDDSDHELVLPSDDDDNPYCMTSGDEVNDSDHKIECPF